MGDRRKVLGIRLSEMPSRARLWLGDFYRLEKGTHLPNVRTLREVARAYELPIGLLLAIRESAGQHRRQARFRRVIGQLRRTLALQRRHQRVSLNRAAVISKALRALSADLEQT